MPFKSVEERREYHRRYYHAHAKDPAVRERRRIDHALWKKNNPEKVARYRERYQYPTQYNRTAMIKHKYGISAEKYMEMAWEQNFSCLACGRHESSLDKRGLRIDHCHATLRVRALLCNSCNGNELLDEYKADFARNSDNPH